MNRQETSLEIVAGYRSYEIVETSIPMQAYLEDLSPELRDRFLVFAWQLYHAGLEEGISRRVTMPSEEQKALLLVYQAGIFVAGARAMAEELET